MNTKRATEIAKGLIHKAFAKQSVKILLSRTVEFPRGWVFFYNTEEYIKNPTDENGVFQSTPILIDKFDGRIYRLFDPIRRFSNCLDWLEDYILMKNYESKNQKPIKYLELDFYKLPTTGEMVNEELMIKMANEVLREGILKQEKDKLLDFLHRNLLDENIWENVWIRERLKSRERINEILKN